MAQEVTVTQMMPDGVEKEFTFRGEIVNVVGALEAQGGKRRRTRTRNRKHKRKLRTAKKSM